MLEDNLGTHCSARKIRTLPCHTTKMLCIWLLSWVCPSISSGIITNSWKRSTRFALCIQFGQRHAFKNSLLALPWRFFAFIEQKYDSKWQQGEIGISHTVALATRNHKKPPSFWPHTVLLEKPWETGLQSVSDFSRNLLDFAQNLLGRRCSGDEPKFDQKLWKGWIMLNLNFIYRRKWHRTLQSISPSFLCTWHGIYVSISLCLFQYKWHGNYALA